MSRSLNGETPRLGELSAPHGTCVGRLDQEHSKAVNTTRPTALAQAYRLLRAILSVAVADEVIPSNPCRVRGAGTPKADWQQTFRRAARAIRLPPVRPHELRHTGATLAAATGATTKELMRRLGHSSPAAPLIYRHAADERDGEIARALDAMLAAAPGGPTGTSPGR
jgi:integrase